MNFFTPAEIVKNYGAAGKKKAEMPLLKMLILGFLSGMFIALGAAVTNTAGHSIDNVSAVLFSAWRFFVFSLDFCFPEA